ncbi:MAG: methyltransferase domain-containing protein [Deltaproteobacteria bacterium]
MKRDISFWHARYHQQASWTSATREYIFKQIGILPHDRLLEVGCGSGAVLEMLARDGFYNLTGIDIDHSTMYETHILHSHVCADGLKIPFPNASFAHSLCHFYLLWLQNPMIALEEMTRITQPDGWVLARAEPDYGGRISSPHALERLGNLQTRSLEHQGADVRMGRRLRGLFTDAGLVDVQGGIIAAQWAPGGAESTFMQDREVLAHDLDGLIGQSEFDDLMSQAEESILVDQSIWFVPIFYAFGRVPPSKKG